MESVVGDEGTVGIGKVDLAELPAEVAELAEVGVAFHGEAAGEGDALGGGFLFGLEPVHAFDGLGHAQKRQRKGCQGKTYFHGR